MFKSAVELSRAIATKKISCVELMQLTLEQISKANPIHNAIVAVADQQHLIEQATLADNALSKGKYRGWMHGMPHAVKDLANLKGFVNSFGSPIFKDNIATEDEIFVSSIRKEGAIFVGKTNVPEFGLGSQSYNTVYGSTKNAINPALTAGGSSGGAAVAIATGMLPVADGSDMMGSLRNPAAFNNVVGFRPGLGKIPSAKNDLFFEQLSTDGPMGRTIADIIQLYSTMAGQNRKAPLSIQGPLDAADSYKKTVLKETRITWMADFDGYLPMQSGILNQCEGPLKKLESAGAVLDSSKPPFSMGSLWHSWLTLRQWFVSGKQNELYNDLEKRSQMKPELIWEIEQGQAITSSDLFSASIIRSDWYRVVDGLFDQADILALPSAQVYPFSVEEHWPKSIEGVAMDTYHRWMEITIAATLCGCPTISLPAGLDDHGRPMGIQFIAPIGQEKSLLEFALAYEEVNPWHQHYSF